ncbi:MAG: hypothetical protein R3C29_04725 [Dehalococcoidia bacterium]
MDELADILERLSWISLGKGKLSPTWSRRMKKSALASPGNMDRHGLESWLSLDTDSGITQLRRGESTNPGEVARTIRWGMSSANSGGSIARQTIRPP